MKIRVTGILIEDGGILLLNQDTDSGRSWSLPGGKVEEGETIEDALVREMREETGLIIRMKRLLYVCDYITEAKHIVHITFIVERMAGKFGDIVSGVDTKKIRGVEMVPFNCLEEKGFSRKFYDLVVDGFPMAGSYMGQKSNIGL